MSFSKVLISDAVDAACVDILKRNGIQVAQKTKLSKEELLQEIKDYDGLIVRSATKVSADVIDAGTKLKLIGRAGTGVDNIDCDAATRNGVLVVNTPGGNTLSAAEQTCALIISLSRQIPAATISLKSGAWNRKQFLGNELYGKTLAIIGLGRIGREVAHRMQAFNMKTIGFDPLVSAEESLKFGVESLTLEQIWPRADYITVHVPLIKPTKNMINAEVLNKCKQGVRIVNVARGGIIDEAALLSALESKQCGGAGLDVFLEEPPPADYPLLQHQRVICTPHLGANTVEAQLRVAEEVADTFVDYSKGLPLNGVVNAPSLSNAHGADCQPWIALAAGAGNLLASILPSHPTSDYKFNITVFSADTSFNKQTTNIITRAALIGMMNKGTSNGINLVNALAIAKDRGITMETTVKNTVPDFVHGANALELTLVKDGATYSVIGGCAAGSSPVIYSINGAQFSNGVTLNGNMLLYQGKQSGISSIIGSLSGLSNIESVLSSGGNKQGKHFFAVRTAALVDNVEGLSLNDVHLAAQLTF